MRESYRDPVGTYATNVMGTVHVLEVVRTTPSARVVINVTSDKCYRLRSDGRSMVEDDTMGGHDAYSSSKGCSELVTAAYRGSFFSDGQTAVASARAGNVTGGGDWARDRLIPDCPRALAAGEDVSLRNPEAVRSWQHVLEPLGGYLLPAERLFTHGQEFAEGWNFGPEADDALPVHEVVERLQRLYGQGGGWVRDKGKHPFEAPDLRLDCSKAKARLGWRPRMRVDQALKWTVEWHKGLAGGRQPRELCLEQIHRFMEMEAEV